VPLRPLSPAAPRPAPAPARAVPGGARPCPRSPRTRLQPCAVGLYLARRRSSPPVWRALWGAGGRLRGGSETGLHRAGNLRNRIQERAAIEREKSPAFGWVCLFVCPLSVVSYLRAAEPTPAPPLPASRFLPRCPAAEGGKFGGSRTTGAGSARPQPARPRGGKAPSGEGRRECSVPLPARPRATSGPKQPSPTPPLPADPPGGNGAGEREAGSAVPSPRSRHGQPPR